VARPGTLLSVLGCCAVLSTAHVTVRWLRWHYLLRRFTRTVRIRDGLRLYFASLPLAVTPFSVGELLRIVVLRRISAVRITQLVATWLTERGFDAAVLLLLIASSMGPRVFLPALALIFCSGLLAMRYIERGWASGLRTTLVLFATSAATWGALAAGLYLAVRIMGLELLPLATADVFARATLTGGLTGIPLGSVVASSAMILEIQRYGITETEATLLAAAFRIGTVWFGLSLSLACLWLFRRELLRKNGTSDAQHFDAIAEQYHSLIPDYVRDRLLLRKTRRIQHVLRQHGLGHDARGLDVGCGQAPYAAALAREGLQITGLDRSPGQLHRARGHLAGASFDVHVAAGSATDLPFADGSFDFAYAINMLHHVQGQDRRRKVMQEIARVVRPGGLVFLHEMNTQNPLFRFYMGYLFPILRKIDEGTEEWILPSELPTIDGQVWDEAIYYFTFLPEFIPLGVMRRFRALEHYLERSRLRRYSAHFMATLVRR
jgi:ubiquinone/menaquinone biosynthesis C-methylase UbiE